jgi:diadenosine tetraphosphate (Ap4A) HIT family hydrolase
MNATLEKFGYPSTLIHSYEYWSILLRPQQTTLGSLILGAHSKVESLGQLPQAAFTELSTITQQIETTLTRCFNYDKINYLMLMMVDPHVHYHVIPRYAQERSFENVQVHDHAWPGPPDLSTENIFDVEQKKQLLNLLKSHWAEF